MSDALALSLEKILADIHLEVARLMLLDLRNEEKRTPALYQAIIKFLTSQGYEIDPSTAGTAPKDSAAGQVHRLSVNLPAILDGDEELQGFKH